MGLTEKLARFAAETPKGNFPAVVIENAKQLVLDTTGVALAASNRKIGRQVVRHALEIAPSPATASIIGGGVRVSPHLAAVANGAMAHALAMDGGNHLPTHILPAALALAEHHGSTGADLLDAVIIAFEVGSKITRTIGRGPTNRGWWHVGLVGPVAAAVASGRLLGLDRAQMASAMGIATCSSAGLRANMGTMSQAYHSGVAARAGMEAAQLARSGFSAERMIIEAPLGFLAAVCGADPVDITHITDKLAAPYSLERPYEIKPDPVCGPAQALVEAILVLRKEFSFNAEDVDSIEADLHYFSLLRPDPADEDAAGYSGAFVIAAAIVHGDVWIDQVSEEAIRQPAILDLMARVSHRPSAAKGIDVVEVRLHDGRRLSTQIADGGTRMAEKHVALAKFNRCASRVLQQDACVELQALILGLEKLPTIDRLMQLASGRA